MKKIVSIIVICFLLMGNVATGVMAQKGQANVDVKVKDDGSVSVNMQFKDMNEAKWALKHVLKMKAQNVIAGYEDGSFRPNKPVTQAEAVVLTMKAAGFDDEIKNSVMDSVYLPFKDVKSIPEWASKSIALAMKKGFLEEDRSGNFQANKPATREWVVKLIIKTLGLDAMDVDLPFKDAGKIDKESAGYVATAVYNNILSGFPDGSFQPNKPVTRAQIAVMLGLSTDELSTPGKIKNKIEGTVAAIEVISSVYSQGTITLSLNGYNFIYPVANNAEIFINENTALLKDIVVGSKAKVVVNPDGAAIYIDIIPNVVKGVIDAVYADQHKVYVLESNSSGPAKEFSVSTDVKVYLNGMIKSISDLKAGFIVRLTLDSDNLVNTINAVELKEKPAGHKGPKKD